MSLSCTQSGGCSGRLNPSSHPCTGSKPLHCPKHSPQKRFGAGIKDQREWRIAAVPLIPLIPSTVRVSCQQKHSNYLLFLMAELKPFLRNDFSDLRLWISHVPWAGVLQEDTVAHAKPQGHISRWWLDHVEHNRCVNISVHSLYTGISLSI